MLKQTISQKQTLRLLPSMILSQKLLTIPTLALEGIVKKELELNPMLEEAVDAETEDQDAALKATDETPADELTEMKGGEELPETEDIPEALSKDELEWDEYFETEAEEYRSYDNYNENADAADNTNFSGIDTLSEGLLLQIHLSELGKKLVFIAEEIISSLTDDGYFTEAYDDLKADLDVKKAGTEFENEEFTTEEIDETVKFLQSSLEPAGIAARNLKECLLIQTERSSKPPYIKSLSKNVLENHFDDLRLKKFEHISKELNITLTLVSEIFEFIHKLNPKPGYIDNSTGENYIIPDMTVKKIDGKYEIFLNEKFTPSLRLNRTYQNLYKNNKSDLDKDTKEYIINNFNRAKWFIDAINSRKETMLKVMTAIIKKQKEFFDNNGEGLKPVYEKEIAQEIKMDSSTISRTVRGKYVQTDFGIYELRSFFTTPVHSPGGEDISNSEVKKKLRLLIESEDKKKPLSDEELSESMKESGFKIARRTVAKYREALHIPVAKLRREIK
jgi:RNA polymerase sigma-54 factor